MKKTIIIAVAVALCATVSMATSARKSALGDGAKYFLDDNDVVPCPHVVLSYPDFANLELGSYAGPGSTPFGQWGLFNLAYGEDLAVGGALGLTEGNAGMLAGEIGITAPDPGINLWGAYNAGGMKLGLGVHSSGHKESMTDTTGAELIDKSGALSVKASFGTEVGGGVIGIPIWVTMNSASSETTNADNETAIMEATGGMEIGGCVRGFFPVYDELTVVPRVHFTSFSYGTKHSPVTGDPVESGDYSLMTLSLGCGANYEVGDDGVISVGAAFGMVNEKDERDTSDVVEKSIMRLPEVTVAAEIPATDWLILRGGVTKYFGTETTDSGGVESVESYSEMGGAFVSAGCGVLLDDFTLDMTVSESHLFEGPYIVSGIADNIALRLSVTYDW